MGEVTGLKFITSLNKNMGVSYLSRVGQVCEAFREDHWEKPPLFNDTGALAITVRYKMVRQRFVSNLIRNTEEQVPSVQFKRKRLKWRSLGSM